MTTRKCKTLPPASESVSEGQKSAPITADCTTIRTGVQLLERTLPLTRHGKAFLVASIAARVVALSFVSHQTIAPTLILTPGEAQELARALIELAEDLDADARAHAWSQKLLEAADASAENYANKL